MVHISKTTKVTTSVQENFFCVQKTNSMDRVEIGQGKSGKPGKVREMTLTLEKSGRVEKKSGKIGGNIF